MRKGDQATGQLFLRKLLIELAHAMRAGTTNTWNLAAEAARIPLGVMVSYQREFRCEYPHSLASVR